MLLAVISDIHGNLEAFQRVLEDMDVQGPDQVVCLGDNIGYGADPEDVVRLLREREIPSILGNHELALRDASQRRWFNPVARQAHDTTDALLSDESRDYLAALPRTLRMGENYFVHGCPPDSVRTYLFEMADKELCSACRKLNAAMCFVGHTHELDLISCLPGGPRHPGLSDDEARLSTDGRHIVNAGSVGQPRDLDNRAKYVLWDSDSRLIRVRRLEYDAEAAARKITAAGMPEQYARRLL